MALNPAKHEMKVDVGVFLNAAFPKHQAAIFDFALFLSTKEKNRFYSLWHEYSCHHDGRDESTIPFLEQYSSYGSSMTEEHEKNGLRDLV